MRMPPGLSPAEKSMWWICNHKPPVRIPAGKGWEKAVGAIRRIDNFTCQQCGIKESGRKHNVHHIIPRRNGGDNELSNLVLLCTGCHALVERQGIDFDLPEGCH